MFLLMISVALTVFLLVMAAVMLLRQEDQTEERLLEIAARDSASRLLPGQATSGLPGMLGSVAELIQPLRDFLVSTDEEITVRLAMAGYRRPEHLEVYSAVRLLAPVAFIALVTLYSLDIPVLLVAGTVGFFAPDFLLTQMIRRRTERIRLALPDALDLMVICMDAGLGIDQAAVRVAEEVQNVAPDLSDELQMIIREQRAGKPRLEAWRSFSERLDIDYVRQFVAMLIQTERFGTPIAHAMGAFADSLRMKRMQVAEEKAAKAGVKMMFPLVLFILPSMFIVILGPAVMTIAKELAEIAK